MLDSNFTNGFSKIKTLSLSLAFGNKFDADDSICPIIFSMINNGLENNINFSWVKSVMSRFLEMLFRDTFTKQISLFFGQS